MKTIGIIGAMEKEIISIKEKMEIIVTKKNVGLDFYIGKLNDKNVVLVRSGIGKVNAAICTQVLIDLYAVDYVINVGIAGAISKELDIGDIVISECAVEHDFDTSPLGDPVGFISGTDVIEFNADQELVNLALEAAKKVNPSKNIVKGTIASGDQFIATCEAKNKIRGNFKALCAEMEGAAIAHTCFVNDIPFVIIRSISDKADEGSSISYEQFCEQSAVVAGAAISEMINMI